MKNAGLDEAQAGVKIARRNIHNLRYADEITLRAESEEELKTSWWDWKRTPLQYCKVIIFWLKYINLKILQCIK